MIDFDSCRSGGEESAFSFTLHLRRLAKALDGYQQNLHFQWEEMGKSAILKGQRITPRIIGAWATSLLHEAEELVAELTLGARIPSWKILLDLEEPNNRTIGWSPYPSAWERLILDHLFKNPDLQSKKPFFFKTETIKSKKSK